MSGADDVTAASSGKGHTDENFPVASWLLAPRHRGSVLAYYRFARAADDVADHPGLDAGEKVRLLDALGAALDGTGPSMPEAEPLRIACAEHGLPTRHGHDLLDAFRRDALTPRTRDWDDLIAYCSVSAMPVGRFVLDVHGEDRSTWPASDALCAALQIVNHLQDCGKDFRDLGRCYLPDDLMRSHGARHEDLAGPRATPALLAVVRDVGERTAGLLARSAVFPSLIADRRLSLEVAVIQRLAEWLLARLRRLDPLADRVHATKAEAGLLAAGTILRGLMTRRRSPAPLSTGAVR